MKKTLSSLFCALAVAAPAAQASIVNLQFTAKIDTILRYTYDQDGNATVTSEQSYNIGNDVISWGEKLVGNLSYDTDTPYAGAGATDDPNSAIYYGATSPNRLRLLFDGGHVFSALPGNGTAISIFNNSAYVNGNDYWGVWAGTADHEYAILGMHDPAGEMFSDTSLAIPSSVHPASMNLHHYIPATGENVTFAATFYDLQQIPEPATMATMAAGLGLMAGMRRRKTRGGK